MTDIDLLPLPEGESSSFGDYEVHDNEAMAAYALANIARAVAPLQAEIERLRAEVEVWKASFEQAASGHATYAEQAEQLQAEVAKWKSRADDLAAALGKEKDKGAL